MLIFYNIKYNMSRNYNRTFRKYGTVKYGIVFGMNKKKYIIVITKKN